MQKEKREQIWLEAVTKHYGEDAALDSVTLSFQANLTTAIVGTSGSGKSTLVQMINGLVAPTSGKVHVFGRGIDYDNLPALRRRIGYAVQGTGLFPHLTVRENITLLARLADWQETQLNERMAALMKLVSLPQNFSGRYPHELSGGQQQRVGLCRAMMLNPEIFLLDEAFGALDPITRADIHQEVIRLQQHEPRTIVMVTHDLREALDLAQYLVVLHRGRVEQAGIGEEVVRHPASSFVADFVKAQLH